MSEFLATLAKFAETPGITRADALRLVTGRAKAEVLADIAAGRVPATVRTFAELHDYVDANYYGGAFDWPGRLASCDDAPAGYADAFCAFWDDAQGAVDSWVRAGRPADQIKE